ncbi:25810_t:CDS:10 [Gigaspora margarita]|uniref:25810_t:CDS:1 n=1 Tax=Gigaspora margarita TaxID=4874 RepID=A0ABN7V0F6_GIGMA|nr:25810_t:CDS:10 [Gigaspora margarita]
MSNFRIIRTIETKFGINVVKYKSNRTSLSAILVDIEAPLVSGFFTIPTEATDDDGCPHTLEHLVFLGSELYPYKGVLDTLANRAFAQGTNAWTETDHTCYTITTAGSEGFLKLLPIYVDHILYPTLTESGHYTEVHHINGKGEDAGLYLHLNAFLHPIAYKGCGYRSETGGLMECLRHLGVEKIRQVISHSELFKVLDPLDDRIASKGNLPPRKRPFVDSAPIALLEKSIQETVEFPDEDESMGQVVIAWLGPTIDKFLDIRALEILYEQVFNISIIIAYSAVSVLQKEFVEIEEPLCTDIDISINEQTRTAILATFENVPTEELEDLVTGLFDVFKRIVNEGIDMERMKSVIQRDRLKTLDEIEVDPHNVFSGHCIVDHVYGKETGEDLEIAVKDLSYYDQLLNFSEGQWIEYLKKLSSKKIRSYHIDNPHIALLGCPSAKFSKKLIDDELKRVEKQRETLGPEKLKELEKQLGKAKELNESPIPPQIIENFPVPSVESITFINVITGRNKSEEKYKNIVQDYLDRDNLADIPYFIQFDHINSAFVTISIHITTASIPDHLRPYLEIYLESFYSLPLNRPNGEHLTFEQLVNELNKDTVSYEHNWGVRGFEGMICFSIKVEASKYATGIQWLRDLLWNTEFTAERLKICATKLLNDIPQTKRDGYQMAINVLQTIQYDRLRSNKYVLGTLNQEKVLPEAIKLLEKNPNKAIEMFAKLKEILISPENLRIHVSGDIMKLPNPKSTWAEYFKIIPDIKPLSPIPSPQSVLTESGHSPGNKGYIVKLPAIENSFAIHSTKGPNTFDSPDLAPLLVLCELLHIMEGVFWRVIRGQGLAYSVWLKVTVETGIIQFSTYKSPDAYKVYDQARKIVNDLASKKVEFDKSELEGAKSGVIYGLVSKEDNIQKAAAESFVLQVLNNLDSGFNKKLISRVQAVKFEDLHAMLIKYITKLYMPETSNVIVISTPGKVKDIQEGFNTHGFNLEVKSLDKVIN